MAFALVFVAAVASATAPTDQYDSFTPQNQDITDHWARLDWQRVVDTSKMVDHNAAVQACTTFGRLPTYRELLTIVDEDPHLEWDPITSTTTNRYIDPNAFPGTPAGPFWSMSPGTTGNTFKVVDFQRGESSDSSGTLGWVRCVIDVVP